MKMLTRSMVRHAHAIARERADLAGFALDNLADIDHPRASAIADDICRR